MATKFNSTQTKYLINRVKEEAEKLIKARYPYYSKWNKSVNLSNDDIIDCIVKSKRKSIYSHDIIALLQSGHHINLDILYPELKDYREAKNKDLIDYVDKIDAEIRKFEDAIMFTGNQDEFAYCLAALAKIV